MGTIITVILVALAIWFMIHHMIALIALAVGGSLLYGTMLINPWLTVGLCFFALLYHLNAEDQKAIARRIKDEDDERLAEIEMTKRAEDRICLLDEL